MAKIKKDNPARKCICSECGVEAVSIPDKTHRKCKHAQKGKWIG